MSMPRGSGSETVGGLPLTPPFTLRAGLLTPLAAGGTSALDDALVVVDGAGRITAVEPAVRLDELRHAQEALPPLYDVRPHVLLPGMVDVHAHLPQVPITALDFDSPLMPWLETYMIPVERAFDAPTAQRLAPHIFQAFAAAGTTTVVLHGAVYADSLDVAFQAADAHGIRAVMGQCLMDRGRYDHEIPDHRVLEVRLQESADLCARWHGRDDGRLRYAFTPRGGLNCSRDILRESARLAAAAEAYWQTHLAEDLQELAATRVAFPDARDYLDIFERAGGVGPRGIFAHSVHLSDDEVQRIASAQGRIAHCPSNLWADGGLMPLARYLRAGLVVGVGSDVGGSSDLSLFTALQLVTITQRILSRYGGETQPILRPLELLRLGTFDGARVLGIDDRVGSVEAGKEADLILIDAARTAPLPEAAPRNADELATRLILHPHPEMVQAAWVRGRQLALGRPYARA